MINQRQIGTIKNLSGIEFSVTGSWVDWVIDAVPLEIKSRFYHESEINLFVSSKKLVCMVLMLSQLLVNHNNKYHW